jgi:hypothetical protein
MSFYPSFFLTKAFAADGDKTLPPATAEQAGRGRFSQELGFDTLTETPITEGGVPPNRRDFNGVLNALSAFVLWFQRGGLMRWSATMEYEAGCEVLHNGTKYRCKQTCTGVTPPNATYWKNLDSVVPLGAMIQFGNVIAIDADGHPKFAGQTEFDLTWALCDGRNGTPNWVGKFARGGGTASVTARGADSFTLDVANLPAHSHGVTVATNGAHTHTRGTMEIEGNTGAAHDNFASAPSGAFYYSGNGKEADDGASGYYQTAFKASRSWTGETSQNGEHSHTVTIGNTGSGTAVSFEPSNITAPVFMKIAEG